MKIHLGDCPSADSEVALRAAIKAYAHAREIQERVFSPAGTSAALTAEIRVLEMRLELMTAAKEPHE